MESLTESILVFGRASAGAVTGLAIGWATQRERHSRYVVVLVAAGFLAGVGLMWPHWPAILGSLLAFPIAATVGTFLGAYGGVATLGDKEDWWLRSWVFAGFVVMFQLLALASALVINVGES